MHMNRIPYAEWDLIWLMLTELPLKICSKLYRLEATLVDFSRWGSFGWGVTFDGLKFLSASMTFYAGSLFLYTDRKVPMSSYWVKGVNSLFPSIHIWLENLDTLYSNWSSSDIGIRPCIGFWDSRMVVYLRF